MKYAKKVSRIGNPAHVFALFLAVLFAASNAAAQQTTGTPCSPSATQTLDGRHLPPEQKPFGGVIKRNALDSKPCWDPQVVPPKAHRIFC